MIENQSESMINSYKPEMKALWEYHHGAKRQRRKAHQRQQKTLTGSSSRKRFGEFIQKKIWQAWKEDQKIKISEVL